MQTDLFTLKAISSSAGNQVQQETRRGLDVTLAYVWLCLFGWNIGIFALFRYVEYFTGNAKHFEKDIITLTVIVIVQIVSICIAIKSHNNKTQKRLPYKALTALSLFRNDGNGWDYKSPFYSVSCNNQTGILTLCLMTPLNDGYNRHITVIEFEKLRGIRFTPSGTVFQVILRLDSITTPELCFQVPSNRQSGLHRTCSALEHLNHEQLRYARGGEYPEIRAEMQKKGWLVD